MGAEGPDSGFLFTGALLAVVGEPPRAPVPSPDQCVVLLGGSH